MDYERKYLKYKTKYMLSRKQFGGKDTKMLVFDFDNTITNINIGIFINKNLQQVYFQNFSFIDSLGDIRSGLFKDPEFIEKLKEFKKNGNYIVIASFDCKNAIKYVLAKYNLLDLFSCILTPIDFNQPENTDVSAVLDGKNKMLELLIQTYHIKNKNDILFVDNNDFNIQKAKLSGYQTEHSKLTGLDSNNKKRILNFLF